MPGLKEKIGFTGYCMSEFESECKDPGPEQCFSWEKCYAEFSHQAPAASSDLTKIYTTFKEIYDNEVV